MILAAEDTGKAGPLGLLVLILLGIGCYFLFRSMSRHLRRVRENFPTTADPRFAPSPPTVKAPLSPSVSSKDAATATDPPDLDPDR